MTNLFKHAVNTLRSVWPQKKNDDNNAFPTHGRTTTQQPNYDPSMASLPSRKTTKTSKKKLQKRKKLTKPRPKKRDTSTGRLPHETTTLARGTWHSWPSPSEAIRTFGVHLQNASELRNRKSVHFADVDSTSSYPQRIQPPTASGSHGPGPSSALLSQQTYNPAGDYSIIEVPRNISNQENDHSTSDEPIPASDMVHLAKPNSVYDPPMVKTHDGLRLFKHWTIPTPWSAKTSLNLGYSISVETCFTILTACSELRDVTLIIGSKEGTRRKRSQFKHEKIKSLSITAAVDPVLFLSYLELPSLKRFSLTWDVQHELPSHEKIGILPLIFRSGCSLQFLSLVNICPKDQELAQCLRLKEVRNAIQELIVQADPGLLPRYRSRRFVSGATLDALSFCPCMKSLRLSHCDSSDNELADMVDRLLPIVPLVRKTDRLKVSFSFLNGPDDHKSDLFRLVGQGTESPSRAKLSATYLDVYASTYVLPRSDSRNIQ